jgi:MYXO-CTERM domain-containing protein
VGAGCSTGADAALVDASHDATVDDAATPATDATATDATATDATATDATATDATATDATATATDATATDATATDATATDATATDATATDATASTTDARNDANGLDAAVADASAREGAAVAPVGDAANGGDGSLGQSDASDLVPRVEPGCSCRTVGTSAGTTSWPALAAAISVLAVALRRRGRAGRGGRVRTVFSALLLVAWFTWAPGARADDDSQRATARALATEGYKAIKEQRWADAADRFTRAEALVHAPPHLLYLGRAYNHLGKLVAAHEAYVKLTRETLPATAPQAAVQAHQDGIKELADLEPRIPTLTISVSPAPASLAVTMDGAQVPPATIGVAIPVDPGDHHIEATADGFVSAQQSAHALEGGHASVSLMLNPAPVSTSVPRGAAPSLAPPATATTAEAPRTPVASDGPSGLRIGGYVALGVAVVAAAAGVLFAIESHDNRSQGDSLCSAAGCNQSDQAQLNSLNDKASLFGELAVASFITAGVAAAAGITMIALPSGQPAGQGSSLGLWFGPGAGGLRGTF